MKAEIGLFSIAILLLLHVAASHSLVRGFRRRRRGHKGHKCLHGVNGICGDPATCTNGKLARGHCKGGASNICCVPSKNVEVKEKRRLEKDVGEIGGEVHSSTPLPTTSDKIVTAVPDLEVEGIERDLAKKLKECKSLYFAYRRKRCAKKAKKDAQKRRRCERHKLKPLYVAVKDGTFEEDFKALVGMSVEQSIRKYNFICPKLTKSTCKTLTREMVIDLFRDSEASNKILMADPNIHWIYRVDVLNSGTAKTVEEAEKRCFTLMSKPESIFHGVLNSKYVDQSGHMESIFNPEGKVVVNIDQMGTFNFFGKANGEWNGMSGAHTAADVIPYLNVFSKKCMKSTAARIALKMKEGWNYVVPKKFEVNTQLDHASAFLKDYGCGYGNYREEFMERWKYLDEHPEIISLKEKRTFWRMFQHDPNVMQIGIPIHVERSRLSRMA